MSIHRRYESPVDWILYDSDDGCFFDHLGGGAYGSIYDVGDRDGKKRVLKVFNPGHGESATEFRDVEVEVLRKLGGADGHAPVCHSTGTYFEKRDGDATFRERPAYEMDFVSGVTLEYAIAHKKELTGDDSPLDGKQALEVMEKVCEAVAACHSPTSGGGSVHRDLAPKNIMVDIMNDAFVSNAVIVDWGQAPRDNLYFTPAMKGTPAYAAPELLRARATERGGQGETFEFELPTVDVWSLGAIAYFVRTGEAPPLPSFSHDKEGFRESAEYKEQHPISLPDDCNNDNYDKYLNEFIRRCTRDNPRDRFQNVDGARRYIAAYWHRKTVPTEMPYQRAIPKDTPVPTTKPTATDTSTTTIESAPTDVWFTRYKLYRGNKPYSGKTSDLLVIGSSQASCAIAAYQWNGDTYIAHRVGDILDVNDNRKEAIWKTVEVVDFIDYVKPSSLTGWFADCRRLKEIRHIDRLDTSAVQSFAEMFRRCESLTSLNLSSFKTSNATDMSFMFSECNSLTSLDLSSFDTSSVTNMRFVFANCSSLTSLNLSSFDTSSVTNMSFMFYECSSLTSLDLSSFDTSNVTDMSRMFRNCRSLQSLDISGFNTSQTKSLTSMLEGCLRLRWLGYFKRLIP